MENLKNQILTSCRRLLRQNDKVLLAVSGGVDSIVMMHLFGGLKWEIGIVHVNFQLRGYNSTEDEEFIKNMVKKDGLPFYSKTVDTIRYAELNKISIQEAARILRYEYFLHIAQKYNYTRIATAHHQDDHIETVLINMIRGCGLSGMTGIPEERGLFFRPLLQVWKAEILQYAKAHQLEWREDESNQKEKYLRNAIRNKLVPEFEKLEPSFRSIFARNIRLWSSHYEFEEEIIELSRDRITYEVDSQLYIKIEELLDSPNPWFLLYHFLKDYGFRSAVVRQLLVSIHHPGKQFMSPGYRCIVDREHLIVVPLSSEETSRVYQLHPEEMVETKEFRLEMTISGNIPLNAELRRLSQKQLILDADKLIFPLLLRSWKAGDAYQPIGMRGSRKKLKKLFTDAKFNLLDKHRSIVLVTGGEICAILGFGIDYRYRVTDKTQRILTIVVEKI